MKFHSKPIEEHAEVPVADEGRLDELVAHFGHHTPGLEPSDATADATQSACYVLCVCPAAEAESAEAQRAEMLGLVEAQGDTVVDSQIHLLARPDARTLIRRGVAERIGGDAKAAGASMLVIDAALSPSQTRNLEDATPKNPRQPI